MNIETKNGCCWLRNTDKSKHKHAIFKGIKQKSTEEMKT